MTRSISADIIIEAGSYFVVTKITAIRIGGLTLDEVILTMPSTSRQADSSWTVL